MRGEREQSRLVLGKLLPQPLLPQEDREGRELKPSPCNLWVTIWQEVCLEGWDGC